jgi:uncharacterized damage-inducible protein DinB
MTTIQQLQQAYERELDGIIQNLTAFPEAKLWQTPAGIPNSGGVLVQHIIGGLNHFISHGLGRSGYIRNRDAEFQASEKSKAQLLAELVETKTLVSKTIASLSDAALESPFPIPISHDLNTQGFLIYFLRHAAYHVGQLNYLRRILATQV